MPIIFFSKMYRRMRLTIFVLKQLKGRLVPWDRGLILYNISYIICKTKIYSNARKRVR